MNELLNFNGRFFNPLIISRFTFEKGVRYTYPEGWDPRKQKLIDALPWYKRIGRGKHHWAESTWVKPCVKIYGANGERIHTVTFKSNAEAEAYKIEMEQKLSDLLARYQQPPIVVNTTNCRCTCGTYE